jgi:hypothetical protein
MTNVNVRAGIVLGGSGALLALFGSLATANAQAEFTPVQPHGITSTDTTVQPAGCIGGLNCGPIGHAPPHHHQAPAAAPAIKPAAFTPGNISNVPKSCIGGLNCGPIHR